jgi:hypothetical protein
MPLNLLIIHVDAIKELFNVRWSCEGSNCRKKEEEAYMMFLDYLYKCEGKIHAIPHIANQ